MYRWALMKKDGRILTCLIDSQSDRTIELHADIDRQVPEQPGPGDIVTARIDRIMYGMDAAFLDLPGGLKGYIPVSEFDLAFFTKRGSSEKYCQGDEFLAQILDEGHKQKAISVTARLSVSDTLAVAGCENRAGDGSFELRISKKPDEKTRDALRDYIRAYLSDRSDSDDDSFSCSKWVLLRTAAAAAFQSGEQQLIEEQVVRSFQILSGIIRHAPYLAFGTIHYRSPRPYLRHVQSIPADRIEKIITDDEKLYGELSASCQAPVELYQDDLVSLYSLYRMTARIDEALGRVVHMRSGGTLVIEPTEALTAIDVNTGKGSLKKKGTDKEEALLALNLEAAREAARQIRLRNLSGIILIDFVNMKDREHEKILMDQLRSDLARDPVDTRLVDITRLGLAEITRKKTERPLHELL